LNKSSKIALSTGITGALAVIILAIAGVFGPPDPILLGNNTLESQHDSVALGQSEAFQLTALISGSATTLNLYVDSDNTAKSAIVGIYTTRRNNPNVLISSGEISSLSNGAWNTAKISSVNLVKGTTYWIALLGKSGTLHFLDRNNGSCSSVSSVQTRLSTLPETWRTDVRYSSCPVSAYVEGNEEVSTMPTETTKTTPTETTKTETTKTETTPPTETVTTPPPPPVEEKPGSTEINCINVPSKCGYPDATNSGVEAGTTLKSTNNYSDSTSGSTVKDMNVNGELDIEANNITVENVEIQASGGSGSHGVYIPKGVTGVVFNHVTCHGSNVQYCIFNGGSNTTIKNSYLYGCGECMNGSGTVENSFFNVTANISGEHYEDIYDGGGNGNLIVNHDTMLNPQGQTATVFASTDFGNQNTLTISNSLLAGGGYTIYGGTSCTTGGCGKVIGPVTISDNRFSKKYYPDSGYYGLFAYFNETVTKFSGNYWDNNLEPIS